MLKVTSKVNHDSLWIKVTNEQKDYAKLMINRNGVSISAKCADVNSAKFKSIATKMYEIYNTCRNIGMTNGESLKAAEDYFSKEKVSA